MVIFGLSPVGDQPWVPLAKRKRKNRRKKNLPFKSLNSSESGLLVPKNFRSTSDTNSDDIFVCLQFVLHHVKTEQKYRLEIQKRALAVTLPSIPQEQELAQTVKTTCSLTLQPLNSVSRPPFQFEPAKETANVSIWLLVVPNHFILAPPPPSPPNIQASSLCYPH